MRIPTLPLMVAVCALAGAGSLRAHHATTKFDSRRIEKIDGVVTALHWKSPHVKIEVAAAGQGARQWTVEMLSPGSMKRAGLQRERIEVGDRVTVYARPLRKEDAAAASRLAWYVGIVLADGSSLGRLEEIPASPRGP